MSMGTLSLALLIFDFSASVSSYEGVFTLRGGGLALAT